MKTLFLKKQQYYLFLISIFALNMMLFGCSLSELKPNTVCKVGAINYALLKYNSSNQVTDAEISNTLRVQYEYDNVGNILRINNYNNNILYNYRQHTWDNTLNVVRVSVYEKDNQNIFQESKRDTFFLDNQKRIIKIKKSDNTYKRFEYENDNVVRVYWFNGAQAESLYIRYTNFDNALNPYYGSSLRMFMFDDTGNGFHFSKNNATQYTYYNNNIASQPQNLFHAYDSNNNPIKLQSESGNIFYFSYVCN